MKKNKEHKKGESTIGKIIYGFLLFMPLFAIGVTCGYAMFNKNAYRSYAEKITNTYLIDSTNTSLVSEGKDYIFNGTKNPVGNTGTGWTIRYNFTFTNESVNLRQYFELDYDINGIAYATDGNYATYFRPYFHDINTNTWNNTLGVVRYTDNIFSKFINLNFTFTLQTYENDFYQASNIIYYVNTKGNLDNVFYYSVDKVTENPLFNWAENSVIYTTMSATCTQLNITAPFIPLLLSYWLIISVIYFLYDIALMLIWLLHDKIHEMRDSLA